MPQHFIKIEIKGDERNLPKDGTYLSQSYSRIQPLYRTFHIEKRNYHPEYSSEWWRENIEWYLLPVPEPQQPEQTESAELNPKYKALIEMYAMLLTGLKLTKDEAISELTELISSILEDVSQSHNNTVGPSETEISAILDKANFDTSKEREDAYDLIKYALSQCKAIDLRATLRDAVKKIFIHTKDDLPKESGSYECYFTDNTMGLAYYDISDKYATTGVIWWINHVKWYLIPIDNYLLENK